jgi:GT2 family glycosyltransferase
MVCYNKWDLSQQAIITLMNTLGQTILNQGVEIIIVNNGSQDDTKKNLNSLASAYGTPPFSLKVFHLAENMGYPVAMNYGLYQCSGRIITVLNNDLVFEKHWFSPLVKVLESDPHIGVTAPFLSFASGIQNMNGIDKSSQLEMSNTVLFTNRVIGACLAIKREVILKVGGNDFWFSPGYFDDDDWCLRIRIAGYKIAVVGASYVQHIGNATFHHMRVDLEDNFVNNRNKFLYKWHLPSINASRDCLIQNTKFSKALHYMPLMYDLKNSSKKLLLSSTNKYDNPSRLYTPTIVDKKRIAFTFQKEQRLLVIADWYYYDTLVNDILKLISQNTSPCHYFFWVSKQY